MKLRRSCKGQMLKTYRGQACELNYGSNLKRNLHIESFFGWEVIRLSLLHVNILKRGSID